ncbi:SMP-30/gluconolactonase/LRE family protein [Rhodococcus sp. NPDC060086]|uniref:SMP-30/gluconolactonase/LRE family protein n=1 Tax=Rhodococcus sp. NPDC060086 TaxID=3347055 RepID=UPI0036531D0D
MTQGSRYTGPTTHLAEGWSLTRLTSPSRLYGANGIRAGADGRIYVAQVAGSQISAFDPDNGAVETISPKGSAIVAPDDLAFHPDGELYITEYYDGRVSIRSEDGSTRLLRDDLPGVNGITFHQGRLFVDECRPDGRLMEIDLNGGAPKVLAEGLQLPNALEVGPDGKLYYPALGTNDIWRIDPDGGEPERVAGDLGVPVALKFDSEGYIISPQVGSGQVLRIDPRTGDSTVLADIGSGLDNLTFIGDRLFVSSFTGQITEVLGGGETRTALADGLTWPLDLTVGTDGTLYVADGTFLLALEPNGELRTVAMLFHPGWPGYIRGVTSVGDGEFIVAGDTTVSRYRPGSAESELLFGGLEQAYGVAVSATGTVAVADVGTGKIHSVGSGQSEVLASGLNDPTGLAFTSDGTLLASEAGAGRIISVTSVGVDTLVDGLERPQGILVRDGKLYIVDVDAKTLISVDLETKAQQVIARHLPVGAPEGVAPKPLKGIIPFAGPQGPFAGIAAGPDGTLYISADAEGSVLAIREGK